MTVRETCTYLPDIDKIVAKLLHNSLQDILLRIRIVIVHPADLPRVKMGTRVDLGVGAVLWTPFGDGEVEPCVREERSLLYPTYWTRHSAPTINLASL